MVYLKSRGEGRGRREEREIITCVSGIHMLKPSHVGGDIQADIISDMYTFRGKSDDSLAAIRR